MLNPKSEIRNPKQILNSNVQNSKLLSSGHWSFGHWLLFGIWCLVIGIFTSGCTTIKEGAKGVAGLSTKILEEKRGEALKTTYDCQLAKCYTDVARMLNNTSSYIYARKPNQMLAIYISEEDTTPVGIFFTKISDTQTQVEVSSPSVYGKEAISRRVHNLFYPPKETEGEKNAQ
jgi:hypothetical protein